MFARTSLLFSILLAATASAGDLTPPAGPPISTMKTIFETEPRTLINAVNTPGDADSVFKITTGGSYYLMANVTGQALKHGIEIAADGVTIDLNGFEVVGAFTSLDGISVAGAARSDIAVRNGHIRSFDGDGLDLAGCINTHIEDVTCRLNGGIGFRLGSNTVLDRCVSASNGAGGYISGRACHYRGCIASANGVVGFTSSNPASATYIDCIADLNGGSGFQVLGVFTFENCIARANTQYGFFVGQESAVFTNCNAHNNNFSGIFCISGTITGCSARLNQQEGIYMSSGLVAHCNAESNGLHGIRVETRGAILNCHATGNGTATTTGAGIRADFNDVRIEGNNSSANDRGIEVAGGGNVIIGNTCSGNTINFFLAANNIYGPVIDRTAPASPAVIGNAAASTMGSTDPTANYAY